MAGHGVLWQEEVARRGLTSNAAETLAKTCAYC